MAIDYGTKRTGLAVSDPFQIIATALETVATTDLWSYLHDYFKKEEVSDIVLGFPKNLDGTATHITQEVTAIFEKLKTSFPDKKIHLLDERFTSKIAFQSMINSGVSKKDRRDKGNLDKISATIILQDFMAGR